MLVRPRRTLPALALVFGYAVGCHSSSSSGGGNVTPPGSGCDDYFDAVTGVACAATNPPPDEVARLRGLFEGVCAHWLVLPGVGVTQASLETCASAVKSLGCGGGYLDVPECTFQGSLADSSPCNDASQCQSAQCQRVDYIPDGGTPPPPCGTCATVVPVGQTCATGDTCAYGAICATAGTGFACATISYGDVGSSCDDLAAECKTGLACDLASLQCVAPGPIGSACVGGLDCAVGLTCSPDGSGGMACSNPGGAGAACIGDADCGSGLGCSVATAQCGSLTWSTGGDACGDLVRCEVGICPLGGTLDGAPVTAGTCPTVLSDGQACSSGDATHTCDTFSECINSVCQQLYNVTCR